MVTHMGPEAWRTWLPRPSPTPESESSMSENTQAEQFRPLPSRRLTPDEVVAFNAGVEAAAKYHDVEANWHRDRGSSRSAQHEHYSHRIRGLKYKPDGTPPSKTEF